MKEKTLDQEYIYQGKIISLRRDVVELPSGRESMREVVEHPGGVCVGALDEDGNVLLIRQYRYPHQEVVLEAPAGKMEYGEDPQLCGERELSEETGCLAGRMRFLGEVYPTPGYLDEVVHLYCATRLQCTHPHPDEDEVIEVERIPFKTALEMARTGEIKDAKTVALLFRMSYVLDDED